MGSYQDKVCVVTGAGSGIGRALATQLANSGARLALSDIDKQGLEATRELLPETADVRTYELDVSSNEAVLAHADGVLDDFGAVHYLFNNAGVTLAATIEHATIDEFDWLLGINLWGPIYGTKAFLPAMLRQGEGHVVNSSSVFGFVTVPTQSAYHVSKFGIRGFTECLSRELTGTGVYATSVHPGGIATNIGTAARFGANAGSTERRFMNILESMLRTTADDCVATILEGVERRKRRIIVGHSCRQLDWLSRMLPTHYATVMRRLRGI